MDELQNFKNCKQSKPYDIKLTATPLIGVPVITDNPFVLFGKNRYSNVVNYGSYGAISYNISGGAATYPELLEQSAIKPFKVVDWMLVTNDANNFNQTLSITYQDANGKTIVDTITLQAYFDAYQISPTKMILKYPVDVSGDFFITGIVKVNTNLQIIVFPDTIVNISNLLDEGDILECFDKHESSLILQYLQPKK